MRCSAIGSYITWGKRLNRTILQTELLFFVSRSESNLDHPWRIWLFTVSAQQSSVRLWA